jgi:hypothetical protein
MSPRAVAHDEQAVEVAALSDFGTAAGADLAAYDQAENRAHRELLRVCDDERERVIVRALIAGDAQERQKISRWQVLAAATAQQARRLAGLLSGVAR